MNLPNWLYLAVGLCVTNVVCVYAGPSVTSYGSIQEAIDKNPGKVIEVPAGDYPISTSLKIDTDNTGLCGPGRIIQRDPNATLLLVMKAANVQIKGLTLTRAEGYMEAKNNGVVVSDCSNFVIQDVQILENRTRNPTLAVRNSRNVRVLNCYIKDYMCITIDDRTGKPDWGFAFNVLDGTGIEIRNCKGTLLQGNTVIDENFVPTEALKAKYHLGEFCKMNPQKGTLTLPEIWNKRYYNAWHQGSAILIANGESDDYVQILGNYIENAAQGVDIHGDHVIMSMNIINNAFMGMKAMHGARNVMITNNQFSRNDLWAIGLMPGATSHATGVAARPGDDPAKSVANVDGGSIIANNIISDFGYGTAAWMWKGETRAPLNFETGQKDFNPPLTDVVVQGNIVYDTGRDKILKDGKAVVEPPHYVYTVVISTAKGGPQNIYFSNNILHPGEKGVSNIPLPRFK